MADVIPLPTAALTADELDTRHLVLVNTIQTLCIQLTLLHPTLVAAFDYSGCVNEIRVQLIPSAHLGHYQGGDNTFRSTWRRNVYLPPSKFHGCRHESDRAIQNLTNIAAHLAALIVEATPSPGGAA